MIHLKKAFIQSVIIGAALMGSIPVYALDGDTIPEEVWANILKHIPISEMQSARSTCQAFKRAMPQARRSRLREGLLNQDEAIIRVSVKEANVSPAFAALGDMHEFHVPAYTEPAVHGSTAHDYPAQNLILSGVAPRRMNHRDAVAYCASLGGGSRLPNKAELFALSRAMGSVQPDHGAPNYSLEGYDSSRVPGIKGQWFWSASVHPGNDGHAFFLDGLNGNVDNDNRFNDRGSVRCVR